MKIIIIVYVGLYLYFTILSSLSFALLLSCLNTPIEQLSLCFVIEGKKCQRDSRAASNLRIVRQHQVAEFAYDVDFYKR